MRRTSSRDVAAVTVLLVVGALMLGAAVRHSRAEQARQRAAQHRIAKQEAAAYRRGWQDAQARCMPYFTNAALERRRGGTAICRGVFSQ